MHYPVVPVNGYVLVFPWAMLSTSIYAIHKTLLLKVYYRTTIYLMLVIIAASYYNWNRCVKSKYIYSTTTGLIFQYVPVYYSITFSSITSLRTIICSCCDTNFNTFLRSHLHIKAYDDLINLSNLSNLSLLLQSHPLLKCKHLRW